MTDQASDATAPEQISLAALRKGLADLKRIVTQREGNQLSSRELSRHLSTLQRQLTSLEGELAAQAFERDELAALYGVSQAIGSYLDLTEVLNEVMDQIIHLTGAERSILMLVALNSSELRLQAARNVDYKTIDSSSFEISRSIVKQVASSGQPIVTTNAQADPRFKAHESVVDYNLRSILCVPLKVRGQITGVIYADNRVRTGLFSERDRDLLAAFASQAAVAIENARLFENVANAKALLDNIFASIASGVITLDTQKRITLFNRAAEHILHVSAPVRGLRFSKAVPELANALRPAIERLENHREPIVALESQLSLPNQEQLNLRINLSPLENADGEMQGLTIVLENLTEQRRLEARDELFQRYLPPAVIERLPADPRELKLGGQRQEITSLFADIRGFTDFSRQHTPEILVKVLNQYLAIGTEAILSEEGTLDTIMGDCIVAFFNAPLPQPNHTMHAVQAALKIQEEITQLHERLPPDCRLFCGIGISVGEAVVGNVGAAKQMNYTAIGPLVNLANQLQEAAAPRQILLSRVAYQRTREHIIARRIPSKELEETGTLPDAYELLGLR